LNPNKGSFNPRAFLNGNWSMEGYYGKNFQIVHTTFENNALQIKSINDSIKYLPGNDFGIRVNYHLFQLMIQSGIGLSENKSEFRYSLYSLRIDSIPHVMPNPDTLLTDSIYYYTYDTTTLKHTKNRHCK
jgi:hypothetical protein